MLTAPRKDAYTNNININNMNLSPHHHHDDSNSHESQLMEQMSDSQKCYSPRSVQRPKLPPHITICPPGDHDEIEPHFLPDDEFENDVLKSPTTVAPSYSDDKHKVHAGRLYLICHTGSACILSSPSRSPGTSPTQNPATSFPFRVSPPPSSQQWPSPSSSPSSSPVPTSSPKISVFVRVYRCNNEHFAVITRDYLYTSKPVYVNMRHSRVIPGDCLGRFIVAGHCDSGSIIEFEVPDLSSLEQWLDAFQPNTPAVSPNRSFGGSSGGGGSVVGVSSNTPPIPRSPILPTLAETDEED